MTRDSLFHIADEMDCTVEVEQEASTPEADEHERFTFWHGSECIFALAIRNGEMPWPGYMLANALMEKLKERKT